MPSEPVERRQAAGAQKNIGPQPPPKLADPLPCPRCESTNTKFCYYNNYNLSQPRHFCKACRRYWTHGGTLRNVPVGGGTRKNSKRSRSSSSAVAASSSTSTTTTTNSTLASTLTSLTTHDPSNPESGLPALKVEKLDCTMNPVSQDGTFMSLLGSQQQEQGGAGFMGMVGYGEGFGYGYCEMGLGFGGRGNWAFPGMYGNGGGALEGAASGCNPWQAVCDVEGGGGGAGDCLTWPAGVAISMAGKAFK